MQTILVKIQPDYIERISRASRPILAIAELIWNGLDADATRVDVEFSVDSLGGIESIRVVDDGVGIPHADAKAAFENLGGSWKRYSRSSKTLSRDLHGKAGGGRFQAFSLGATVTWLTAYEKDGNVFEYRIVGCFDNIGTFSIEEPKVTHRKRPGTIVVVHDLKGGPSLLSDTADVDLTDQLALYLIKYDSVAVTYNGKRIDPKASIAHKAVLKMPNVRLDAARTINCEMTVIEWKRPVSRSLVLCDDNGFPLHETAPGVQAPGFNFTAYLKSDYLRTLSESNALVLETLDPDVQQILDMARMRLRSHFRKRSAEQAQDLVSQWIEEDVYPYTEPARDVVEESERQVFDVLALSVNDYLPDFHKLDKRNRKLSFRLLRQAIEQNASAVLRILEEVLDLPYDKQNELAVLLEKTSLAAIINASKEIVDRLDFIRCLQLLVFDSKQELLERRQLHRILADKTWLFGEEYRLSVDDESLTVVLEKHNALLGRPTKSSAGPVLLPDGSRGIIDLMLSRVIHQARDEEREHLVVELKRPSQKIDDDVATQIRKYAFAVAKDERFRDTKTRWNFVAISNEVTDTVWEQASQHNKPKGLLHDGENVSIWIKTWAMIIRENEARLRFYQERLNYTADNDSALENLKQTHERYLPGNLRKSISVLSKTTNPVQVPIDDDLDESDPFADE